MATPQCSCTAWVPVCITDCTPPCSPLPRHTLKDPSPWWKPAAVADRADRGRLAAPLTAWLRCDGGGSSSGDSCPGMKESWAHDATLLPPKLALLPCTSSSPAACAPAPAAAAPESAASAGAASGLSGSAETSLKGVPGRVEPGLTAWLAGTLLRAPDRRERGTSCTDDSLISIRLGCSHQLQALSCRMRRYQPHDPRNF